MKTKLFRKIVQTHCRASLIVQTWRATSLLLLLLLLLPCGCTKYEDNAIWDVWDRLNSQDARIAALEEWQATMNRDIVALQTIVTALRNYDYITGVTPFTDPAPGGHYVTFTKSGQITIWNGSNGADGADGDDGSPGEPGSPGADAPQIGVAQYPDDSGVYYWTLDGEWLLDGNEDKIPVTGDKGDTGDTGEDGRPGTPGATPKVAIGSDGNWYVSPDGSGTGTPPGDGWEDTGTEAIGATGATGPQGDAIFAKDGIDYDDDDYVVFTLADLTEIKVLKYRPLNIAFDQPGAFINGETKEIPFTPTGNVQTITAVDVPRGWTVTPNVAGNKIAVTAPANGGKYYTAAGTVTLLVSDGAERTVTQPLALSLGVVAVASGTTGDCSWTITGPAGNYTLAISGSGAMGDYGESEPGHGGPPFEEPGEPGGPSFPSWNSYSADIKTAVIADGVTTVGNSAFTNYSGLTSVTIGNSVTTIGERAFQGCSGLTSIVIPNAVTTIGRDAFNGCSGLTSIAIGNSVTTIGTESFIYCSSLTSIVIPNSVTTIASGVFFSCTGLQSVTIGHAVQSIGNLVFKSCTGLKEVISHAAAPPSLGDNPFDGINLSGGTLKVPAEAVAAYKAANYWKNFGSIVPIFGIAFTQPAAFTNGETKEITFIPAGNVQTITAVDVPRGWTVTPNVAGNKIAVTAPANGGTPYTATGTVTLIVSDGADRTVTQPLALACEAYTPPAGLGIVFEPLVGFAENETKKIGFTLTGGGAIVKALDVPQDWTVKVTVVDAAGTFTVTAPAAMDETNVGGGEILVFVTDAAGNTVMRTLTVLGTPKYAATSQIWKFGNQLWSDVIYMPNCDNHNSGNAKCYDMDVEGVKRNYFSSAYLTTNGQNLCSYGWDVPSESDANTLLLNSTQSVLWAEWYAGGYLSDYEGQSIYETYTLYHTNSKFYDSDVTILLDGTRAKTEAVTLHFLGQLRCVLR